MFEETKILNLLDRVLGGKHKRHKKQGQFAWMCPFCNHYKPKLEVNILKSVWHCWVCDKKGRSLFTLLKGMRATKAQFDELGGLVDSKPRKFKDDDKSIVKLPDEFKPMWEKSSNPFYKNALSYLRKRGISRETISEFQIGFVPDNSDIFDVLSKKFNQEDILKSGLFYKNEKYNKFVNRFYSRIIFPIRNIVGDVIAFGGRIIDKRNTAKYINSPETEFYKKGRHIFNLDKAKSAGNKNQEVIIVEGYMDVISVYSSGIKNVVSNSGTALTENQISLIWKFFSYPIVCLDGDKSGQMASLRIAENLLPHIKENNKIGFVNISKGMDPDDYIREKGKINFEKLIASNVSIEEFIWRIHLNNLDRSDPFATSKFEKKFKDLCKSIKDHTLRKYILEHYLEKIRNLTPLQKNYYPKQKRDNYKIRKETKNISIARDHLTKEEIKEYSILYVMLNFAEIITPRFEILNEVVFSSKSLNNLKSEIISIVSQDKFNEKTKLELLKKYPNLIDDIDQNAVIKNIFLRKNEKQRVELFKEILKELNEIKFSKKIDSLEEKVINDFDEKSYSDLIKLKSQVNKD